ncbi:hypothetical protein [Corynebacterium gerontici]|uniref:hypothetical protein n=1 Tax=Corynebacterium gerontici TaxID=2079234 RepID=UPI00366D2EA3
MLKKSIPNKQGVAALLITCGLAGTWAVPALIDHLIPTKTMPAPETMNVGNVSFHPPQDFRVESQTDPKKVTLVHSDGSTIVVSTQSNVKDLDTAKHRKVTELQRDHITLNLEGNQCTVTSNEGKGPCGFAGENQEMAMVYELSPNKPHDITPLLKSITFKEDTHD